MVEDTASGNGNKGEIPSLEEFVAINHSALEKAQALADIIVRTVSKDAPYSSSDYVSTRYGEIMQDLRDMVEYAARFKEDTDDETKAELAEKLDKINDKLAPLVAELHLLFKVGYQDSPPHLLQILMI